MSTFFFKTQKTKIPECRFSEKQNGLDAIFLSLNCAKHNIARHKSNITA